MGDAPSFLELDNEYTALYKKAKADDFCLYKKNKISFYYENRLIPSA